MKKLTGWKVPSPKLMCTGGNGTCVVGFDAMVMNCGHSKFAGAGDTFCGRMVSVAIRSIPVLSRATITSSPVAFRSGINKACTTGGGEPAAGSTLRNRGGDGKLTRNGLFAGSVDCVLLVVHVLNAVMEGTGPFSVTKAKAPVEEKVTPLAGAV